MWQRPPAWAAWVFGVDMRVGVTALRAIEGRAEVAAAAQPAVLVIAWSFEVLRVGLGYLDSC